jgi:aspartate-semialdehyde dehydrogenase
MSTPPTTPSSHSSPPTIAIVGVTGAVGREMIDCLTSRGFRFGPIKALASARSAGTVIETSAGRLTVEALDATSFDDVDIALFSAGSGVSKQFAPLAARKGVCVIDNSSAFRMDEAIPLIVPEVNAAELPSRPPGQRHGCIIANPNCSAIIMVVALTPLHRAFGIERIVVSTYQAASGAGAAAMQDLQDQTASVLAGKPPSPKVFHEPYAFNLFSHNASIEADTGLNGEEAKMIAESRKIWRDSSVRISPTCVRVPVLRAHAEAINVTLSTPTTLAHVREVLAVAPGVTLVDDRANNLFPTPQKASGQGNVLVGRLREDPSQTPARFVPGAPTIGFDLFVAGDQLLKGAALNAVQIAELMFPEFARPQNAPAGR